MARQRPADAPDWTAEHPVCRVRLIKLTGGGSTSNQQQVEGTYVVLGRQPDACDVVIDGGAVSRKHAAIIHSAVDGAVHIVDLNSKHGTWVETTRLQPQVPTRLRSGDLIRFSSTTDVFYRIILGDDEESPSGAAGASGEHTSETKSTSIPADSVQIPHGLPTSMTFPLAAHTRAVTSLGWNKSGSRLITGSMDNALQIFDFGGMRSSGNAWKSFDPDPGHIVRRVAWSPIADIIGVATGSATPKILDRNGELIVACTKGDPYINDMTHTKGHVAQVTGMCWHPCSKSHFLTSSVDGSVRTWDLEGKRAFDNLTCQRVCKARDGRGARVAVMSCCYSPNGKTIAAVCEDGSLQLWRARSGPGGPPRPDIYCPGVHNTGASVAGAASNTFGAAARRQAVRASSSSTDVAVIPEPTCVCFSPDGRAIATRGGSDDNTVKLWDVRMVSKRRPPFKIFANVFTGYASDNVVFMEPGDGALILAAASCSGRRNALAERARRPSEMLFFSCKSAANKPVHRVEVQHDSEVTCMAWQSGLRQLVCGYSDGACRIFYDESSSQKGVLLPLSRASTMSTSRGRRADGYANINVERIAMNDAQMHQQACDRRQKRKRAQFESDAGAAVGAGDGRAEAFKPSLPVEGIAGVGKRGDKKTFTQMVMQNRPKSIIHPSEDPRLDLLRYEADAAASPKYVGAAYAKTDPNRLLAAKTLEQEEQEEQEEEMHGKNVE